MKNDWNKKKSFLNYITNGNILIRWKPSLWMSPGYQVFGIDKSVI